MKRALKKNAGKTDGTCECESERPLFVSIESLRGGRVCRKPRWISSYSVFKRFRRLYFCEEKICARCRCGAPSTQKFRSGFKISDLERVGVVAQTGRGFALPGPAHLRRRWLVLTAEVGHAVRKVAWPLSGWSSRQKSVVADPPIRSASSASALPVACPSAVGAIRFRRRKKPSSPLIQMRRQRREALPDGVRIDHSARYGIASPLKILPVTRQPDSVIS